MSLIIFDWQNTLFDVELKRLAPSVTSMLKELREKGHRLAIRQSAYDHKAKRAAIRRTGISDWVDFINITPISLRERDEYYLELIYQFNYHWENTIVVDDQAVNLDFPKQCGSTTIWIKQGRFCNESGLRIPDFTVYNIEEAVELILEGNYYAIAQA